MIHIVGDSFAPNIFRQAARHVGYPLCSLEEANLVLISQDTPTQDGKRNVELIKHLVIKTLASTPVPVILTSQVEPGFTRQFDNPRLFHQAETLRIKDAFERAIKPEQHVIGCRNPDYPLPLEIHRWLERFPAPILKMTYEEAEFSKIAINVSLAYQVQTTNALWRKARDLGCDWEKIKTVLQHDKRMGAYLEPGEWRKSPHLLRDWVSFETL